MALPQPPAVDLEATLASLHEASFGWACSCCRGDADEAADALQTAYAKVLTGTARFGGRSSFKTWFFGVIRLTALERSRDRTRHLFPGAPDDDERATEPVDVAYIEAEQGEALRQALQRLAPRQQEVLHLVFYQDVSIAEAAVVMGVSLGSARTHYERGKQRLRTMLSPTQAGDPADPNQSAVEPKGADDAATNRPRRTP